MCSKNLEYMQKYAIYRMKYNLHKLGRYTEKIK
jgi:hypothetical protein